MVNCNLHCIRLTQLILNAKYSEIVMYMQMQNSWTLGMCIFSFVYNRTFVKGICCKFGVSAISGQSKQAGGQFSYEKLPQ